MSPLLTAAILVAGLAFFAFTMTRRLAPLAALRKDVRWDRAGERVRNLLAFGFGQRRLPDRGERVAGVLHVLIFVAFLVLALRTVTMFGMGFAGADFHLPLLAEDGGLGRAYLFVKDLVVLGALVGVAGFLWRRLVSKPDRITLSTEGVVILLFIAGLMVSEILYEGGLVLARAALGLEGSGPLAGLGLELLKLGLPGRFPAPAFDALAPAGSLGALALHGLGLSPASALTVSTWSFWLHL